MIEIHFDTIDSTNTYAKENGSSFDKDQITCIIAECQTQGKGQFQRKWISPPHVNLYVTFYFHLNRDTQNITSLATLLSLSIKKVLETHNLLPTIKWPNDILLNQKKIGGVLCETIFHPHHIEIILGFGLNVNMETSSLGLIDQPATSLKEETGHSWNKKELLKEIQEQFMLDISKIKCN